MIKTNVTRILQAKKIPFDQVTYNYDADNPGLHKMAAEYGLEVGQVFKTLATKGNKTGIIVAVVPGDQTLDFKLLAKATGNKKMTMLPLKDLQGATGYIRGGCSPIGMKKVYPVFIEKSALNFDKIYVNAGKRGVLIGINPDALAKICNSDFVEIASAS